MSDRVESEAASNPSSEPTVQGTAPSWLEALNGFLERAYLQADVSTGC
jgi:hypothetical protein